MKTLVHNLRPFLFLAVSTALIGDMPVARADAPAAAAESSAAPFTREQMLASLNRAIGSHFNLDGELQVELLRPWTPPAQVAAAWDLTVTEFPSVATSSMMVRCKLVADGVQVAETSLVLRAQLWRDVWATRQPLSVGTTFDPSLLETRRVDVLRDRDTLPAAIGDKSYVFARAVPAGRMLTWRDVARRPLVRKGEVVEVSAVDGPLVVTLKGLAMENGAQGDTISIRNPESRKTFAALVVDESRVQIRF